MDFQVLTKKEAAQKARLSLRMLEIRIKAGTGPSVTRIGSRALIRTDELQAWLVRCTVPSSQAAA